jgi:excisionase family DNA binding protein
MDKRETYSVMEAAVVLGIGRDAAYQGVKTGDIPSVRVGARILVPKLALQRLLEQGAPANAAA